MSIVIKRTGRNDDSESASSKKPLLKWKLTFGQTKEPTSTLIAGKGSLPSEKLDSASKYQTNKLDTK